MVEKDQGLVELVLPNSWGLGLSAIVVLGKLEAIDVISLANEFGVAIAERDVAPERAVIIKTVRVIADAAWRGIIGIQNNPNSRWTGGLTA